MPEKHGFKLEKESPGLQGQYKYGPATIWISGPVGGTWWATVRFSQQETDLEARSYDEIIEKAKDWIDALPELQGWYSERDKQKFIASKTVQPRILISYTRLIPGDEGEEHEEEHGWIDEEGVEIEPDDYDADNGMTASESIVNQAAKFLKKEGATEASSSHFHIGIWYSTGYDTVDFSTGTEEERAFHLKGFTPSQESAIFDEVVGSRGRRRAGGAVAREAFSREVAGEYHTQSGKIGAKIHRDSGRHVTYSYSGEWGAGSGLSAEHMKRIIADWTSRKRGMKVIIPFTP